MFVFQTITNNTSTRKSQETPNHNKVEFFKTYLAKNLNIQPNKPDDLPSRSILS